jgi:hypothetical protein
MRLTSANSPSLGANSKIIIMTIKCVKCNLIKCGTTTRLLKQDPTTYKCKNCRKRLSIDSSVLEFIEGCLLGDGILSIYGQFVIECKHKTVLENIFKNISLDWRKVRYKPTTLKYKGETKIYPGYLLSTMVYEPFKQLATKWYTTNPDQKSNRKRLKIIPSNFQLHPTKAYYWFINDGSSSKTQIQLATQGFTISNVNLLVQLLNQIGIEGSRWSDNTIGISAKNIQKFYDYIGPCKDPEYSYKWKLNVSATT